MRSISFLISLLFVADAALAARLKVPPIKPGKPGKGPTEVNKPTESPKIPDPPATGSITGKPSSTTSTTALDYTCADSDVACNSCVYAIATLTACESAFPAFDNLNDPEEAKCVCYNPAPGATVTPAPGMASGNSSNLVFVPNQFDGPWSQCISWAKTAQTTAYSDLNAYAGFCSTIGNVRSVASTDSAPLQTANFDDQQLIAWKQAAASGLNPSATAQATSSGKSGAGSVEAGAGVLGAGIAIMMAVVGVM